MGRITGLIGSMSCLLTRDMARCSCELKDGLITELH